MLGMRAQALGCDEAMLLSTCNRIELYGAASNPTQLEDSLSQLFSELSTVEREQLRPHLYLYEGEPAFRHLFRVAASLDSMVVGEAQILGQLKAAYEEARQAGRCGATLNQSLPQAFSAAKKIRSRTAIGRSAVSISSVAVQLAQQIFDDLDKREALLVGAGEMSELAARHLRQQGVSQLLVANRSLERAVRLAERLSAHPRSLDELPQLLTRCDIVITSTGATTPIITGELLRRVLRARKYRPLFLIDIAVPRDVEAAAHQLDNVFVYDLDDLQEIAAQNQGRRAQEADAAEPLLLEELERFRRLRARRALDPLLRSIAAEGEARRAEVLDAHLRRFPLANEQDLAALERFSQQLTRRLLHPLLTGLKGAAVSSEYQSVLNWAESNLLTSDLGGDEQHLRASKETEGRSEDIVTDSAALTHQLKRR